MNVFLWKARARNGHVEATWNHPCPAQVAAASCLDCDEILEKKASREALVTVFERVLEGRSSARGRRSALFDRHYAARLLQLSRPSRSKADDELKDRHASLVELFATFDGRLSLKFAANADHDALVTLCQMSKALAPYTCDESPTSVYNRHHRAHFWRRLLANFPGLIDFAAERLADPPIREAFFAHLVDLERFLGSTTSARGKAVAEIDRSSVLYYLLASPPDERNDLVDLLNNFEASRGRDKRHSMMHHRSAQSGLVEDLSAAAGDDDGFPDVVAASPKATNKPKATTKPTAQDENRNQLEDDMQDHETKVLEHLVHRFSTKDHAALGETHHEAHEPLSLFVANSDEPHLGDDAPISVDVADDDRAEEKEDTPSLGGPTPTDDDAPGEAP